MPFQVVENTQPALTPAELTYTHVDGAGQGGQRYSWCELAGGLNSALSPGIGPRAAFTVVNTCVAIATGPVPCCAQNMGPNPVTGTSGPRCRPKTERRDVALP